MQETKEYFYNLNSFGVAMSRKPVIITFCAHNDDQIVGVGGTIAKYVKEGKEAYTYIFCYGEKSHPHLKEEVIRKTRIKESIEAEKILGDKVTYFGILEGKVFEDARSKGIVEQIKSIITSLKPEKIFTHCLDDPHPDHRGVLRIMNQALDELKYQGEVYSFDVWNPINIRRRNSPKLAVDITETFGIKMESFRIHKSQKVSFILLGWLVWLRAVLAGLHNKTRYAELFYRVR